jgi:FkbM family methyltransferase
MVDKKRVFYSQNREDLILLSFFSGIKKGFYIDVGAYDPDVDSVTKLFYDKGWCGINIEPQIDRIDYFKEKRPRDINLNIGVSSVNANLKIRSYKNQGLSTFSDEIKKDYNNKNIFNANDYIEYDVPVITLKDVYQTYVKEKIVNFLKVDVEGLEYEVLKGNDWKVFRPQVICIEANHIIKDWVPLLIENQYLEVFNDGLNKYFADTRTNIKDKFDYVETVVMQRDGGISYEDYKKLDNLSHDYKEAVANIGKLELKNSDLIRQRDRLYADLTHYNGFKAQLKSLLHTVNDRFIKRLDRFGEIPIIKAIPLPVTSADLGIMATNEILLRYDDESFSDTRLFGSIFRRKAYSLLKNIHKILIFVLRQCLRISKKVLGK